MARIICLVLLLAASLTNCFKLDRGVRKRQTTTNYIQNGDFDLDPDDPFKYWKVSGSKGFKYSAFQPGYNKSASAVSLVAPPATDAGPGNVTLSQACAIPGPAKKKFIIISLELLNLLLQKRDIQARFAYDFYMSIRFPKFPPRIINIPIGAGPTFPSPTPIYNFLAVSGEIERGPNSLEIQFVNTNRKKSQRLILDSVTVSGGE